MYIGFICRVNANFIYFENVSHHTHLALLVTLVLIVVVGARRCLLLSAPWYTECNKEPAAWYTQV